MVNESAIKRENCHFSAESVPAEANRADGGQRRGSGTKRRILAEARRKSGTIPSGWQEHVRAGFLRFAHQRQVNKLVTAPTHLFPSSPSSPCCLDILQISRFNKIPVRAHNATPFSGNSLVRNDFEAKRCSSSRRRICPGAKGYNGNFKNVK